MSSWWLPILFFCSVVVTGLCRLHARRVSMLDIPNERSSHAAPTPTGGGVGLVLTFVAGSSLLAGLGVVSSALVGGVVLAGLLVAVVGYLDDHYPLSAKIRLLVHALAAGVVLAVLSPLPSVPWFSCLLPLDWFGYLLAALSLIWLLNLYNFMDGIDGIAGTEAVSVSCGALLILLIRNGYEPYGPWLAVLAVSVAGFLVWNWPPAKIFMGDVGSGFIGLILGCFALLTSGQEGISIWTWFILLGVFIVDATVTLVRRLFRRERFWQPHRSHAYQILSRRFRSHARVTLTVLLINTVWLLPWALFSAWYPEFAPLSALAALLPLAVLVVMTGAGTTND